MDGSRFLYVATIPEPAAMLWLAEATPNAHISGRNDETVTTMLAHPSTSRGWMNKIAVVVSHERGEAIALYMKDGKVWLIREMRS
jgi:hypothetical protein